ncbi:MAG: SUMF1/EgtB/PvdO family nonheme iron enzyme [Candidatus Latescibacteria bacterium]|nr:SUMF1/EgtB/PvdO family nonheme iron enzyme [bacterium]MBD3425458.1 SUMF1/EgtB/PvdO family nonheme iron enzyme [Candidatus Latescibacterota bacterium]
MPDRKGIQMMKNAGPLICLCFIATLISSCGEDEIAEPEPDKDPEVRILTPENNRYFPAGDSILFTARAENHGGVGLQPDMIIWISDKDDTLGSGYSFYRDDLSVNTHGISLMGCDMDGNCSSDEVTIHVTSNQPPTVSITGPGDGSSFLEGEMITFTGEANDCEDGILSGSELVWVSGTDGTFGTGDSVRTNQLSGQIHLVTLTGTDSDGNSTTDSITVYITHSMVSVPAVTSFPMGGGLESDELPVHQVNLDGYSIGRFEVSYYLWSRVKTWGEANGYSFASEGEPGYGADGSGQQPVVMISWGDCIAWCNAFSEMNGYTPVYYRSSSRVELYDDSSLEADLSNDCVDWNADGFRLPTEAEWECAARYIDGSSFSDGDKHSGSNLYPDPDDCVWHSGNSGMKSYPVGRLNPNSLGLHDMTGNIWEWCWDRYDPDYYSVSPLENPLGPASGSRRLGRGGSWNVELADRCHTSERLGHNPTLKTPDFGFRICRSAP